MANSLVHSNGINGTPETKQNVYLGLQPLDKFKNTTQINCTQPCNGCWVSR